MNPIGNLPFILSGVGEGARGMVSGMRAADDHERLMTQMEEIRQAMAQRNALFPSQLAQAQRPFQPAGQQGDYMNSLLGSAGMPQMPQGSTVEEAGENFNRAMQVGGLLTRLRLARLMHDPRAQVFKEQSDSMKRLRQAMLTAADQADKDSRDPNKTMQNPDLVKKYQGKAARLRSQADDVTQHMGTMGSQWGSDVGFSPADIQALMGDDLTGDSQSQPAPSLGAPSQANSSFPVFGQH